MTINNAFTRLFVVALTAAAVVVPQAAMADGQDYNGYKPVSSSYTPTYSGYSGYKPVSSYTPTYYSSPTKPSYSYYSYPTKPSYSSYYSYPSYSSYSYYPSYSSYSTCGYYYDCGSDIVFSWNDNENENSNFNYNYNYNRNDNDNDDDDDRDRDRDDDEPWCDITASDRTVDEGDRVTLEWDTRDADYASINEGIGRVDEDGGDIRVRVDEDTTFRMTVRDDDGDEDTCSVTVRVDEDNDFSSVVYVDEPSNNPPPKVYLSSIPYTGLEDLTPELLMYWLLLIAGIGGAAFYAIAKGIVPNPFAFALPEGHMEGEETIVEEAPSEGHVNTFICALQEGNTDSAMEHLRTAAVEGAGVEAFLEDARAMVTDADPLAATLDAMIAGSRLTGIRGAREALA